MAHKAKCTRVLWARRDLIVNHPWCAVPLAAPRPISEINTVSIFRRRERRGVRSACDDLAVEYLLFCLVVM